MKINSKNYLNFLLTLGLIPALLIGSQTFSNSVKPSKLLEIAPAFGQTISLSELDQNLSELDLAYDNFVTALVKYLEELQQAVQQKRPANAVILNDTYEKLQALALAHQKINTNLPKLGVTIPDNIKQTSNSLDLTLKDIAKIVDPLKSGLEPQPVRQIQEYLDFFKRRNIDPKYYGTYGATTQEEVELFFADKSKQLNIQINRLKTEISQVRQQWTIPPTPAPEMEALSQEIERLKAENAQLKAELSKYAESKSPSFNWWLLLLTLVVIGGIILLVKRLLNSEMFANQTAIKPYNMTHNDILVIEEEIYGLIAQEFQEQFKKLEQRLTELEQKSYTQNLLNPSSNQPEAEAVIYAYETSPGELESEEEPQFFTPEDQLLKIYQQDPQLLAEKAITVTEKKSPIQPYNSQRYPSIFLEKSPTGNYWIVNLDGTDYLIPKANISINDDNYPKFKLLFECYGYQPGHNHSLKLLQPGIVSKTDQEESWEFAQIGVIECHIQ